MVSKNNKFPILFSIVFLVFLLFPFSQLIICRNLASTKSVSAGYVKLTGWNMTNVIEHIKFFSSLETRATGYSGNYIAASYIYEKFKEYGLVNVSYEEFSIVNVVSEGPNTITIDGETYPIHPGEPNFVAPCTTPPEGISGPLIYGGDGYLKDLENKTVKGSIVILNWDTEMRWLDVATLGAKAVIFIPPMQLSSPAGDRHTKSLIRVPLKFPRFYVDEDVKKVLMQHLGETVTIKARQVWKKINAKDIVGFIPGTDPSERIIILLSSYYDSYSQFPTVAPGAQEACGIAALLELVRVLSLNPPRYTIMVAAYSAHHQALQGSINLANEYIYPAPNITKRNIGRWILVNFNLDLSTGSDATYLTTIAGDVPMGRSYGYQPKEEDYGRTGKYFRELNSKLGRPVDKYRQTAGLPYYAPIGPFPSELAYAHPTKAWEYDQAPYAASLVPPYGFTFTTAYDARPYYRTPFDTLDKVNYENLKTQLDFIYTCINSYLREDIVEKFFPFLKGGVWLDPQQLGTYGYITGEGGYGGGGTEISSRWNSLKGTTAVWDPEKAFWKPLPHALVSLDYYDQAEHYSRYYTNRRFTFSDENGNFTFIGAIWGKYWSSRGRYVQTAWVVNETTGDITYAPDLGQHRYADPYVIIGAKKSEVGDIGFTVLFKAALIILKLGSPESLTIPATEAMPGVASQTIPPVVTVYRSDNHVTPESWGVWVQPTTGSSLNLPYALVTVAVPTEMPIEIAIKETGRRYPFIALVNSSEEEMIGGYTLKEGEQLLLENPYLRYAKDLYWLNKHRVFEHLAGDPGATDLLSKIETYLEAAEESLAKMQYVESQLLAAKAWNYAYKLNTYVRTKIEDSVAAVPLVAFLLVPFALLFERLVFNFTGVKRVISTIGSLVAVIAILYLIHPGFSLAASPIMIVMGFSVLILSSPIIAIIVSKVFTFMRVVRIKALGKHEEEVSRGAQFLYASSVAVQNMRRRKLRSTLSLITVMIMVASMVSFTSVESMKLTQMTPYMGGVPTYLGIYIHKYRWGGGSFDLGQEILQGLIGTYGEEAIVAPRAWRYTLFQNELTPLNRDRPIGFRMTRNDEWAVAPVLLGLTPQEAEVTGVDGLLTAGRWFLPGEKRVCIINERQADWLGINATDVEKGPVKIELENMEFTVIGIMSDEFESIRDLDGEGITPLKMDWRPMEPNPFNVHVSMDYVLILPYDTVISLGGGTASVSIKFTDPEKAIKAAQEISDTFSVYQTFLSVDDKVYQLGSRSQVTIHGITVQIVPLSLVFASILNIMLGTVHERRKEISIYSSVGLSPFNVATMFLTESAVTAFVGAVVGYILGIAQLQLSGFFLPGAIYTNFSSSTVMLSVGVSIVITLLSSIYPMMLAARLVTPSLERAWKIPTSPIGNVWEVPLPFGTASEEEAKGMLAYLYEFVRTHEGADAPVFSASEIKLEVKPELAVTMIARLSPYEVGVSQDVKILMPYKENRWFVEVIIQRLQGPQEDWERLNRGFLSLLRQQLLLWRVLPENEKKKYSSRLK